MELRHSACRVILVLGLLLAGSLVLRAQTIPNPYPPDALSITTLPNGLRLIVREDHSLPIVTMVVVVRGGVAFEGNTLGAAHFLEHLTFQGTHQYPAPLQPQETLEKVGGISNAVSNRDTTRFQATVESGQAALLVNILAEVTQAPLLDDEMFTRERPTILAEIQRESDNPVAVLLNRAYQLTYRSYPYRNSPLGSIESVLSLASSDVRDYYRRCYLPNNMSVILVGDITVERAGQLVAQAFGTAKAGTAPVLPEAETPAPADSVRAHYPRKIPDTYQVLAFSAPASSSFPDMVMMDLLTTLLADGADALLPARWEADHLRVARYGVEYISTRGPARLMIWAETDPESVGKVRDSTLALMRSLATTPLPQAVFVQARQRLAAQFLLENETYSQQASILGFYEGLGGAQLITRYTSLLQSAGPAQLRAVAPAILLGWITLGAPPEGGA